MFVASFLSLATGLPVKRRTAFTGEIDYRCAPGWDQHNASASRVSILTARLHWCSFLHRGRVVGVGAIVEKARGAQAAGVTTLICPEENAKELKVVV